jgi:hypothetical protein
MTRSRTRKASAPETTIDTPVATEAKEPVNIELNTPSAEPEAPAEAAPKEKIETDVRAKLSNKSVEDNVFVPTNPAALEKEAKVVAEEKGFDLNRGTSIGARLMARRRLV